MLIRLITLMMMEIAAVEEATLQGDGSRGA
jgi:hypothetical protein